MQCPHCECEIADSAITSEAARIYNRRRKAHRGQAPRTFTCRWCGVAIQTRAAIELHTRDCSQRPASGLAEVSAEDMAALAWMPPDAA
jgi:hypothetical protein